MEKSAEVISNYTDLELTDQTKSFNMTPFYYDMETDDPKKQVETFFKKHNLDGHQGGNMVIAHPVEWIFAKTIHAIDHGGVYRVDAAYNHNNDDSFNSPAPNLTPEAAVNYKLDLKMLKDVYRATFNICENFLRFCQHLEISVKLSRFQVSSVVYPTTWAKILEESWAEAARIPRRSF